MCGEVIERIGRLCGRIRKRTVGAVLAVKGFAGIGGLLRFGGLGYAAVDIGDRRIRNTAGRGGADRHHNAAELSVRHGTAKQKRDHTQYCKQCKLARKREKAFEQSMLTRRVDVYFCI